MQAFVVEGKGDKGLPYQTEGLPADLKADESVAGMFLERQGLVLEGVEKGEEKEEEKGESGKLFFMGFLANLGQVVLIPCSMCLLCMNRTFDAVFI
jgi:hypothetical protein